MQKSWVLQSLHIKYSMKITSEKLKLTCKKQSYFQVIHLGVNYVPVSGTISYLYSILFRAERNDWFNREKKIYPQHELIVLRAFRIQDCLHSQFLFTSTYPDAQAPLLLQLYFQRQLSLLNFKLNVTRSLAFFPFLRQVVTPLEPKGRKVFFILILQWKNKINGILSKSPLILSLISI